MRDVEIRETAAMRIVGVEHRGPYAEVGAAFERLHQLFGKRKLYGPGQKLVAVYFDDSALVPEPELRALAAMAVEDNVPAERPLVACAIEPGPCAVLRHVGPYDGLGAAYDWLFHQWLPQSGRVRADRPCFEVYLNTPMNAEPQELVTEICLPLR